jgi:serine/threonine-protein kinase
MAVISLFTELIDQYKIERHLARKRYTDLYLAFDVDENRQVLLDVLRPEYTRDELFVRAFLERARSLAQIRHPNIIQIYQVGRTSDQLPYVAQAFIDGYPLSQRLEQLANQGAPVHSIYALKLIRQLAQALMLADRLEMVHYELQPDHVLLKNVTQQTDDVVVLRDLFIPLSPSPTTGASEDVLPYLSPEQREGKDVDVASHVYSLGVLLYELLVGHPPPRPVQLWEPALRGLTAGATLLQRERDDLSPELYALVDRCLRREPRRRFQSIREFLAALDGALSAEQLRLSSSVEQMAPGGRRPWTVIFALLLLALLLASSILFLRNGNNGLATATAGSPVVVGLADATASPTATNTPTSPAPAAYPYPYPGAGEAAPTANGAAVTAVLTRTPAATRPAASATPTPTAASPTARATMTITPQAAVTLTDTPTPQPAVRVIVPSANIRTGPGTDYRILGFLLENEVVSVLAWNGEGENPWYVVLTDGDLVGWLSASATEPVTAPIADNPSIVGGVPPAATIPAAPTPTATSTFLPTFTPSPTVTVTLIPPVPDPGDGGGDDGGGGISPPPPTTPAEEPTRTPEPLP